MSDNRRNCDDRSELIPGLRRSFGDLERYVYRETRLGFGGTPANPGTTIQLLSDELANADEDHCNGCLLHIDPDHWTMGFRFIQSNNPQPLPPAWAVAGAVQVYFYAYRYDQTRRGEILSSPVIVNAFLESAEMQVFSVAPPRWPALYAAIVVADPVLTLPDRTYEIEVTTAVY